jgi:hypothetical protein
MSASTGNETPKVGFCWSARAPLVWLSSVSSRKSWVRAPLLGSRREVGKLLGHTKLDIVLSSNTHQSLSEMMDLLAGLRVSMFQMLLVEESCR